MIRQKEQQAAVAAVRAASAVTRDVQQALVQSDTLEKKDKSPVTVADFASQAVVCHLLARSFPDDPVVGEENADELRSDANTALAEQVVRRATAVENAIGDREAVLACIDRGGFDPVTAPGTSRYWTLDPIDGTKGFLRQEQYAIALALIEDGNVVLGVLGCPNLPADGIGGTGPGTLLLAVRGHGCRMLSLDSADDDGHPVHVSDVPQAAAARFCESVESAHSDQSQSARIARHLGITTEPVRMDSQAKYAAVARGDASIYLRLPTRASYQEKIWDHAAGMIAVEEAGGRVTDIIGQPLDFSRGRSLSENRGIVATNGKIHDAVLAAIAQA